MKGLRDGLIERHREKGWSVRACLYGCDAVDNCYQILERAMRKWLGNIDETQNYSDLMSAEHVEIRDGRVEREMRSEYDKVRLLNLYNKEVTSSQERSEN
jgi:hypothetical protein